MNIRMKKLAEEAGFIFWPATDKIDWASNYDEQFVKFCDLLVEHLSQRLSDDVILNPVEDWDKGYNNAVNFNSALIVQNYHSKAFER